MGREKVAVVGGGVAGLATAWLISKQYDVTLLEKNNYIGGHTHTIDVYEAQERVAVDTGFIVYNEPNYPNLVGLFNVLGVETRPTDMSFAASIGKPGTNRRMEYAGSDLNTLFAQRSNLFRPSFIRMVSDIIRFNKQAKILLDQGDNHNLTLGSFLTTHRFGSGLINDYLLPMAAAIWSCPTEQMLQFPALSFARFFNNHGLLNINDRPQWRTVVGGSHRYAQKLIADIELRGGKVLSDSPVTKVKRLSKNTRGIEVHTTRGDALNFDKVVFASHADETLSALDTPTALEKKLLSKFHYQLNHTYLHTDLSLMPRNRRVWSSWNYLSEKSEHNQQAVSVTYWMNNLQGLTSQQEYLVSLNPLQQPSPETIIEQMEYHHPVFDTPAMNAQTELQRLQGVDNSYFCGSYFGYGFHEDALTSAVQVAQKLGVAIPWLTDKQLDMTEDEPTPQLLNSDNKQVKAA